MNQNHFLPIGVPGFVLFQIVPNHVLLTHVVLHICVAGNENLAGTPLRTFSAQRGYHGKRTHHANIALWSLMIQQMRWKALRMPLTSKDWSALADDFRTFITCQAQINLPVIDVGPCLGTAQQWF